MIEWDPARKYEYRFVADANWDVSSPVLPVFDFVGWHGLILIAVGVSRFGAHVSNSC